MNTDLLVIGAGYVGAKLCQQAESLGILSLGVKRKKATTLFRSIDLCLPECTSSLPDCKKLVVCIPPEKNPERYITIIQTIATHYANRANPPQTVIHISSTGVYADNTGLIIDSSIPTATSHRPEYLLKAEQAIQKTLTNSLIIRPSRIYGPKRYGLCNNIMHGKLPEKDIYLHHIHRDDLVNIILLLLDSTTHPKTVIASDPNPMRVVEVYTWLSNRMNKNLDLRYISAHKGIERKIIPEYLQKIQFDFTYPSIIEGYSKNRKQ